MKTRYGRTYGEDVAIITEMVGKTMVDVTINKDKDEMTFTDTDGVDYVFYHDQDCCESVTINDVVGELADLVGFPLAMAEEVSSERHESNFESHTWTFYKFGTMRGSVTVRWLGNSNGYYSETVNFRIQDPR